MDEVFPLWDSLLKKLTLHQSHFLTMLTDEMLVHLISPSMLDITIDTYREAITVWLERIYTTKGWAAATKRGKMDENVIMQTCLQNQNHWTIRLASAIIASSGRKIAKEVYEDRVTQAVQYLSTKSKAPIIRSISIENIDRLLPSQRKWLESEEGLMEKARYEQRSQRCKKQSEQTNQAEEPTPDDCSQQQGMQARGTGVTLQKDSVKDLRIDSEEAARVEGWSKWKGMWIAKPIGMV